jgi:hypothetical protein
MPIFDLFSKRLKRQGDAGKPILYTYDKFPTPFRTQVAHIWESTIGHWRRYENDAISNQAWAVIHNTMARELGVPALGIRELDANPHQRCLRFLGSAGGEGVLDIIEVSFRVIDTAIRKVDLYVRQQNGATQEPDDAIAELNHRFREHAIGYQFVGGELIRVDSQFLHVEAVERTITLLHDAAFTGPNAEFLAAYEHYRKQRYKEAIADALKSLESTLKAICEARDWEYDPKATAKPLLDTVVANDLVPAFLEGHLGSLRATLESGLPTLRNRTAGHGQGATPVEVPSYLAAYALHLAAVTIVFLVDAHNAEQ